MKLGITEQTRMPSACHSAASDSVSPFTANLLAQ